MPRDGHTAELIRQVCRLVDARDEQVCKQTMFDCARIIALPVDGGLASRSTLSKVVKDCTRAMHSLEALGGTEAFLLREKLSDFAHGCKRAIPAAPVKSGGDWESPIRKLLTVELAVELILNCGDRMPTVDLVSEVA